MLKTEEELSKLRRLLKKKPGDLYEKYESLWKFAKGNFLKYMNIENFTDHGEDHVQNVEENIYNLLTPEARKKLSPFDVFCLLAACCLHDIGMISKLSYKEPYRYTRKNHHIRVKDLLEKEYSKFNLNHHEGKVIGQICYGHGIANLDELEVFDNWSVAPYGEVNVMLLTALLRIGDLTDLTFKRAPELVVDLKKIKGKSLYHWNLHKKISNIKIDHKEKEITIVAVADDEYDLTRLYNLRNWAQDEFSKVKEIFEKNAIFLEKVSLRTNLHRRKVLSKENPFLKLASFDWTKHAAFFGRDKEIKDIRGNVFNGKLMVLVGESGVGKTSLLDAGLKQRLIVDGIYVFRARISNTLQSDLYMALKNQFPGFRTKDIFDLLRKTTANELDLVLFIDQFEEIFTFDSHGDPMDDILGFFREILKDDQISLKIVLGIREDFLAELWEASEIVPQLYNRENTYRLKRLNWENAQQIIKNTIGHVSYSIDDDLVDELLEDFIKEEDSENIYPPYIQIVCHEVFKRHKDTYKDKSEDTPLGMAIYEKLGRAKEIISVYFEEILDGFSFEERTVINDILAPMITYFHTKQRISYKEIMDINNNRIDVDKTLNRLINHRIIKKIETEKDEYELVHDFLAKKIRENKPSAGVSSKIKKAIEYIDSYFDKPRIPLQEIADELDITREHFCRLFKAETSIKFVDYLNDRRIKEARKYIDRDPRIKIKEVYKKVGFTNAQHFTKTFKKIVGCTPKEYK